MDPEQLFVRLVENYKKVKPKVSDEEARRHVANILSERDKGLQPPGLTPCKHRAPTQSTWSHPPPAGPPPAPPILLPSPNPQPAVRVKQVFSASVKEYRATSVKASDSAPASASARAAAQLMSHTPKQLQVMASIADLQRRIAVLRAAPGATGAEASRRLTQMTALLKCKEQLLRRLRSEALRQRKRRNLLKSRIARLAEDHPELRMFTRGRGAATEGRTEEVQLPATSEMEARGEILLPERGTMSLGQVATSSNERNTTVPIVKTERERESRFQTQKRYSMLLQPNSTPKQLQVMASIADLQRRIAVLRAAPGATGAEASRRLTQMTALLKCKEQLLRRLRSEALRQRKRRNLLKSRIARLAEDHPELRGLPSPPSPPDADSLTPRGFLLTRRAAYLRLQPARGRGVDGKLHVRSVPVRLLGPGPGTAPHPDAAFAAAVLRYLDDLRPLIGPAAVAEVAADDRARVALGRSAARPRAPLLMTFEYPAAVLNGPALFPALLATPSASLVAVGGHAEDGAAALGRLADARELGADLAGPGGRARPVLLVRGLTGPWEGARLRRALSAAAELFRRLDLDALVVAAAVPGETGGPDVERRLAPLSRQLCGLLLPAPEPGAPGMTSADLRAAGEVLVEVFSDLVIDGGPVAAELLPGDTPAGMPNPEWTQAHARQSRYLLQIVRCFRAHCCGAWRSNWAALMPGRFLPAPFPLLAAPDGLRVPEPGAAGPPAAFAALVQRLGLSGLMPRAARSDLWPPGELPFDLFCPSALETLPGRVCRDCGVYFPCPTALQSHARLHRVPTVKEEPLLGPADARQELRPIPVFPSVMHTMRSPWGAQSEG